MLGLLRPMLINESNEIATSAAMAGLGASLADDTVFRSGFEESSKSRKDSSHQSGNDLELEFCGGYHCAQRP
jgi:hypothetical protein